MLNYLEFQQFEKQLEHCLSSTAVRTKFAAHTSRGKDIIERYLPYPVLKRLVLPFTPFYYNPDFTICNIRL